MGVSGLLIRYLLFLLKYNPDIVKVYGKEGVEIWEVRLEE